MHRYRMWNGAMPTTAALAAVTTGTAIKTMLQLAAPSTRQLALLGWGYSIDDAPGADSVFELITADVAATVTAHVAAGVQPLNPGMPASLVTLGTSATGYTATVEGTPTATRVLDVVSLSSTSAEAAAGLVYVKMFEDYEIPIIAASGFVRIRATTPTTAVDMRCWLLWDE